jgi:hypothetical protein
VPAANKQLERTVIRRRVRAACASFHYAHAARWTRGHAAAQLRRYAAWNGHLVFGISSSREDCVL